MPGPFRRFAPILLGALLGALLCAGAVLASASTAAAEPVRALTRIDQIRRLTSDEAAARLPVRIVAIVTYHDHSAWNLLFVQDATGGIYVDKPRTPPLEVGEAVEIIGVTAGEAKVTYTLPPNHRKQVTKTFRKGDTYLIPNGTRARFEVSSAGPYLHVCVIMPRFEYSKDERLDQYS